MIKEYGYEYDSILNKTLWKETQGKVTDQKLFGAICLRSGRDALKAIAREFEPCTAWLPALACDSMIHPFELYGHRIRFYRLNSDYSIDMNSLDFGEDRILFLYSDYFGRPSINEYEFEILRSRGNVVFIEDMTHTLIWERQYNFKPDYFIASLRKWLPIPDGGLLWGNITKQLGNNTAFSSVRLKAQCMRHDYLCCGDESIKTEYRKIFSTVSALMDQDEPCAMSSYSYALSKNTDWNYVKQVRMNNAKILIDILSASPFITFIQDKVGYSDLYVAFTVPNRNEVQMKLSSYGIFNTIIWPLTQEQKEVCSVASHTEENMLAAPCDQRYTEEDMVFIGAEIVRVINAVNQ